MRESTLTMKFKGMENDILEDMISSGLFATKSEVVRSAVMKLATDLHFFERKNLWKQIKHIPRRTVSTKQLLKDIEAVKNEA